MDDSQDFDDEDNVLELNRRGFLKAAGTLTAQTLVATKLQALTSIQNEPARTAGANDQIQIALIGAGIQGQGDTKVGVQVPGVKLVAVADCYDGRLEHAKELWGGDIFTTRDYNTSLPTAIGNCLDDHAIAARGGAACNVSGGSSSMRKLLLALDQTPEWSSDSG